jgi:hypothetical protein
MLNVDPNVDQGQAAHNILPTKATTYEDSPNLFWFVQRSKRERIE